MGFIVDKVLDDSGLKEIYRLRYKVYVEEWGFERPENHPDGIEIDEFDKNSIHFAAKDNSKNIIGTVRLILNSQVGFPIEEHCKLNINKDELPRNHLAEISRLAISKNKDELPRNNLAEISGLVISKQFRRRAEDKFIYGPEEERREIIDTGDTKQYQRRAEDKYHPGELYERRRGPDLVLSLYRAIYHESKRRNITHWYAVMTKGLYILLKRFGIDFEPIGQPVDYHGIRTPYLGDIKKIEHEVSIKNPELYEEFTRGI